METAPHVPEEVVRKDLIDQFQQARNNALGSSSGHPDITPVSVQQARPGHRLRLPFLNIERPHIPNPFKRKEVPLTELQRSDLQAQEGKLSQLQQDYRRGNDRTRKKELAKEISGIEKTINADKHPTPEQREKQRKEAWDFIIRQTNLSPERMEELVYEYYRVFKDVVNQQAANAEARVTNLPLPYPKASPVPLTRSLRNELDSLEVKLSWQRRTYSAFASEPGLEVEQTDILNSIHEIENRIYAIKYPTPLERQELLLQDRVGVRTLINKSKKELVRVPGEWFGSKYIIKPENRSKAVETINDFYRVYADLLGRPPTATEAQVINKAIAKAWGYRVPLVGLRVIDLMAGGAAGFVTRTAVNVSLKALDLLATAVPVASVSIPIASPIVGGIFAVGREFGNMHRDPVNKLKWEDLRELHPNSNLDDFIKREILLIWRSGDIASLGLVGAKGLVTGAIGGVIGLELREIYDQVPELWERAKQSYEAGLTQAKDTIGGVVKAVDESGLPQAIGSTIVSTIDTVDKVPAVDKVAKFMSDYKHRVPDQTPSADVPVAPVAEANPPLENIVSLDQLNPGDKIELTNDGKLIVVHPDNSSSVYNNFIPPDFIKVSYPDGGMTFTNGNILKPIEGSPDYQVVPPSTPTPNK